MIPEERKQQILLEGTNVLRNSLGSFPKYVHLRIHSVDDFSDKAFQLSYSKYKWDENSDTPEFEAIWIPKRVLRKGIDSSIWMAKTFFDQIVNEEEWLKKNNKRRLDLR